VKTTVRAWPIAAWLAALLVLITPAPVAAAAAGGMTLTRTADAVIVEGASLEALTGKDIAQLRVFAFHAGRPRAVPFQVDQRDSAGNWVWDRVFPRRRQTYDEDMDRTAVPGTPQHAVRTHDDQDPAGKAELDTNDLLVFLARDMGDRYTGAREALQADAMLEIEATDPIDGSRGWTYLAYFGGRAPALSDARYMHHVAAQRHVISPIYRFQYSDQLVVRLDDLRICGNRILDRINLRGKVLARLGPVKQSIAFTENDIHGYIEGMIEGPVRIVKRNIVHLELWGVIRTPDVTCEHFYYPDYAQVPVCLPIRFPVTQASVLLLTELHDSPVTRTLIGMPDGTVSDPMNKEQRTGLHHSLPLQWIAFDSALGSVISIVELPPTIAEHATVRPCLCEQPPDTGDSAPSALLGPVAGFEIKSSTGCPRGPHTLHGIFLISTEPYQQDDELGAYNLSHKSLIVTVTRL